MPGTRCAAPNCTRTGEHMFPKDKERRDKWIHAMRRGKNKFEKWEPTSIYTYLCSSHFTEDDYNTITSYGMRFTTIISLEYLYLFNLFYRTL